MNDDIDALATIASITHGVPKDLITRSLSAESTDNPRAVSPKGARGIAQWMPETAKEWNVNPDDPASSIDGMARWYRHYGDHYGKPGKPDYRKAVWAYNAGPGAVDAGHLPGETRGHLKKVFGGSDAAPAAPKLPKATDYSGDVKNIDAILNAQYTPPPAPKTPPKKSLTQRYLDTEKSVLSGAGNLISKGAAKARSEMEGLTHLGTGLAGQAVGMGYRMLGGALDLGAQGSKVVTGKVEKNGLPDMHLKQRADKIAEALTYQPTMPQGKVWAKGADRAMSLPGKAFDWIDEKGQQGADWLGHQPLVANPKSPLHFHVDNNIRSASGAALMGLAGEGLHIGAKKVGGAIQAPIERARTNRFERNLAAGVVDRHGNRVKPNTQNEYTNLEEDEAAPQAPKAKDSEPGTVIHDDEDLTISVPTPPKAKKKGKGQPTGVQTPQPEPLKEVPVGGEIPPKEGATTSTGKGYTSPVGGKDYAEVVSWESKRTHPTEGANFSVDSQMHFNTTLDHLLWKASKDKVGLEKLRAYLESLPEASQAAIAEQYGLRRSSDGKFIYDKGEGSLKTIANNYRLRVRTELDNAWLDQGHRNSVAIEAPSPERAGPSSGAPDSAKGAGASTAAPEGAIPAKPEMSPPKTGRTVGIRMEDGSIAEGKILRGILGDNVEVAIKGSPKPIVVPRSKITAARGPGSGVGGKQGGAIDRDLLRSMGRSISRPLNGIGNLVNAHGNAPEDAGALMKNFANQMHAIQTTGDRDMFEAHRDAQGAGQRLAAENQKLKAQYEAATGHEINVKGTSPAQLASANAKIRGALAAHQLRQQLYESGIARRIQTPGYQQLRENFSALNDGTGKQIYIRSDAKRVVAQALAAYDMQHFNPTLFEKLNHGLVSWTMVNPVFHIFTVTSRLFPIMLKNVVHPAALRAAWIKGAEILGDRKQLADAVMHNFRPMRQRLGIDNNGAYKRGATATSLIKKMQDKGWISADKAKELHATAERLYQSHGYTSAANFIEGIHGLMARTVNRMGATLYAAKVQEFMKRGDDLETAKYKAGEFATTMMGTIGRDAMNRTWGNLLGTILFSRGYTVSVIRQVTKTVRGDPALMNQLKAAGLNPKELEATMMRNRAELAKALLADFIVANVGINLINYGFTSANNLPDKEGKRGGHFAFDNPGSTWSDYVIPSRVDLYEKGNGKIQSIGNPFRTTRDQFDFFVKQPAQMLAGDMPSWINNKVGPEFQIAESLRTGKDRQGFPIGSFGRRVANAVDTVSPIEGIGEGIYDSYQVGDSSLFSAMVEKKLTDGGTLMKLTGAQPREVDPDQAHYDARDAYRQKDVVLAQIHDYKQYLTDPSVPEDTKEKIRQHIAEQLKGLASPSEIRSRIRSLGATGPTRGTEQTAARYRAMLEEEK